MEAFESLFVGKNSTPNTDNCMPQKHNNTIFITNAYEGIPETLTLNVVCWICLLLLFAALRRTAWNYGRLALVQQTNKWTHLFYNTCDGEVSSEAESGMDSIAIDAQYCSWIPAIFKLSRDQIKARCGPDAVHYLSFQRHLITLTFFITLVSLIVILPINFQGKLEGDRKTFGHTTISNLEPTSSWLWVHAIIGFSFLPISILLMKRCTGRKPPPDYATRTLMITNISKPDRNAVTIKTYLKQLFPEVGILDVQMTYNTRKLTKLDSKREVAFQAKVYSEVYLRRTGKHIMVKPKICGEQSDGIEYYSMEETRLSAETERRKAKALYEPLGIAFVTVSSHQEVEHIITQFRPSSFRNWVLNRAPAATDIFWENLNVDPGVWYTKAFFVNFSLFIVLFFLSTPAIIVNTIDAFEPGAINKISPLISEFLPTLLLWTMAALLPVLVSYSDQWLSHWTRSQQTYSIMMKTFIFLLMMTLILPSLGLTSVQAFVEWTFQPENSTYRWECIFLPDKGAFFVNYVITSAFIGTALELIRFPELFMYAWYLCLTKSKAEKASVQKAILLEFPFGVHYAWTLVVFTITTVYSVACPLITPFGMVYLLFKHFGDKHNLYFAYGPSDMSGVDGGRIHATAVRLVRVSVLLLQISMAALAGLRGGMDARTIVLILFTLVTLGMFLMLSPFPSCKSVPVPIEGQIQTNAKYIAPVLLKPLTGQPSNIPSINDYGSSDIGESSNHNSSGNVVNL